MWRRVSVVNTRPIRQSTQRSLSTFFLLGGHQFVDLMSALHVR